METWLERDCREFFPGPPEDIDLAALEALAA